MTGHATSLDLQPIELKPIREGGYRVSYRGHPPRGAQLLFAIADRPGGVEVTARPATDLFDAGNLPQLLALVGRHRLWGSTAQVRLIAIERGAIAAQSNTQSLVCPVKPWTGRLGPRVGKGDGLTYSGIQTGRQLHMPAIDGCYYFKYGGRFETDARYRGLNCITFVGAVFGVAKQVMDAYGTKIANHLGATPCKLENVTGATVKKHFARRPRGTYLIWSASHIALYVNGVIHEFARSRGGYAETDVLAWSFGRSRYWVRKTPKQF